ncbi:MAG: sarcosine oxidase subunit gamma [Planktomarina sp.]
MHNLTPITPLGAATPRLDTHGPITLVEEVGFALASVASRTGGERSTKMAIKRVIGAAAPDVSRATSDDISCFWTGPDQWFIEAPFATHENLADQIKAEVKDKASVTEQTDGWCRFDLAGQGLEAVFELLCPINIRKFAIGDATRTTIEHTGCFVVRRASDHISVIGPRSSAGSLHHGLLTAIKSAH